MSLQIFAIVLVEISPRHRYFFQAFTQLILQAAGPPEFTFDLHQAYRVTQRFRVTVIPL